MGSTLPEDTSREGCGDRSPGSASRGQSANRGPCDQWFSLCCSFRGPLVLAPRMRLVLCCSKRRGSEITSKSVIVYTTVRFRVGYFRSKIGLSLSYLLRGPSSAPVDRWFSLCCLREVGSTLPEDTSCEGRGGRSPGSATASQQL